MEGVGDRRDVEKARDIDALGDGPDPLVVLERKVAKHLLLRA